MNLINATQEKFKGRVQNSKFLMIVGKPGKEVQDSENMRNKKYEDVKLFESD